jgi:aspartate/methionine/tyrosine aminotransferase
MRITPFAIERVFARHEFSARYLLSSSDCESLSLREVLDLADDEARRLWEGLRLGYTESLGLPLLRREVASTYDGVEPDEVLEVVPEEGILLTVRSLLDPGDHAIVTFPGYQSLYQIALDQGCEVTRWQAVESGGWRFDLDELRTALRRRTKLVVVNFPHNPTGALPSRRELAEIVELVEASGARLFCDEMYRHLERDPERRLPSAVELSRSAIVLSGLSKTLSAPGLRVGWLVTHDAELRRRLAVGKDYTTICASAPSEILALMVLRARARIAARNRALIETNVGVFERFLAAHDALLSWTPPLAGSVALPRLRAGGGAALCARLVEDTGVMLLPSSVFDYGDAHVRIGLGRASFTEGLAVFDRWLSLRRPGGS